MLCARRPAQTRQQWFTQKGPIVPEPGSAPVPRPEPRDPDLQAQIEELRGALQDWRRKREYSHATEERLAKITVQCARMVESWQQMEQRRSAVVASLEAG